MATFMTVNTYNEDSGNTLPKLPDGSFSNYGLDGYILSAVADGTAEEDAVYLRYINNIQMQQNLSIDRSYTFSSLHEQHSGFRERIFNLSGRSGDGYEDHVKFYKMRNFIEKYAGDKEDTENAFFHKKKFRLKLHLTFEMEQYECSILSFSYQREAGVTTNSYIYSLSIAVISVWNDLEPPEIEVPHSPAELESPPAVEAEEGQPPVEPPAGEGGGEVAPEAAGTPAGPPTVQPANTNAIQLHRKGNTIPDWEAASGTWREGEAFLRELANVGPTQDSRGRPISNYPGLPRYYQLSSTGSDFAASADQYISLVDEVNLLQNQKQDAIALARAQPPSPTEVVVERDFSAVGARYDEQIDTKSRLRDYVRANIDLDFRRHVINQRIKDLQNKGDQITDQEQAELNELLGFETGAAVDAAALRAIKTAAAREKRPLARLAGLSGGYGSVDTEGASGAAGAGGAAGGAAGAGGATGETTTETTTETAITTSDKVAKAAAPVADAAKNIKTATSSQNRASTSWYEDVSKFVGGTDAAFYSATVATLTTPLTELGKIRNYVAPLTSGLANLSYASRSLVGAYYNFLPNMKSFAFSTVANVRSSVESLKQTYGMLEDMTSPRYWRELSSGWSDIWGGRRRSGVYLPTVNTLVLPTPVPGGINNAYDAAQRFLGDRGRWREIVAANNMQDAYTNRDGEVISVGDTLLIPSRQGLPSESIELNGVFGSDLKIKDGDLVLRGASGFEVVEGEENFKQSFKHRMTTERGTNRAFPNFGVRRVLNEKQTSLLLAQFMADVSSQARSDRRVRKIRRLRAAEQATKFLAYVEIELANMKTQTITLEYTPPI
jgi:hypothetical protein